MNVSQPTTAKAHQPSAKTLDQIHCVDPATRQPLGSVRVDSPADVDAAVARAKAAQKAWGQTSCAERRRVLGALLAYTVEHKEEICAEVQRGSGKTRENALLGEIWPACEKLRWTLSQGEKHLRPEKVSSGLPCTRRRVSSTTRSAWWRRSFRGTTRSRTSSTR